MLHQQDKQTLQEKGISENLITEQLNAFKTGFPFLKIINAAEIGNGITKVSQEEITKYQDVWDKYLLTNATILKFVPASGAASRMFKDLFEFLDSNENVPGKHFVQKFFDEINRFAFYPSLNEVCLKNNNKSIDELIEAKEYKAILKNLLHSEGLNYGALPKGLLLFHSYPDEKRTPVKEHLVEAALYATNKENESNVHFTVSEEHKSLFEKHINAFLSDYEQKYNVKYSVTFSEQKPSTDTLAADENNQPFRDENGNLVFRPGGHGALIENLNDLEADVIFIKNIDNVVPDSLKDKTVTYKKIIAGILVDLQQQSFEYLKQLKNKSISDEELNEIADFCDKQLNNQKPDIELLKKEELRQYLITKLNRPIRVCGMVKNSGEPGGGPFLIENNDGSISPQILESSQIDVNNSVDKAKMMRSTHFNPVDLVCGVKNYEGKKFDLLKYVDKNTGFISLKSKNGKELKALELPGLWNGAMSDWNTIFVEVPVETFNPVKTVNDLLRPEHQ
ncbi:DUF4301 family protein [Paludibacter sp. 221]|uniref:DUF4301 family protein n=1 Tax=Paludibacter sp. 221 TaxID=2302939 RepID=UPI0013D323C7|nr:DUF4301 family protein [Paludibacter sp. 221]NDV46969.1 DUF4301 family protein [Paludibacter sp. 221]